MALTSTIYRFDIELNDIDRGVYRTLAPRVACHPSESMAFMATRLLAFCLEHEEGIVFGGGVSTTDEPALWVKRLDGRIAHWIDVGAPSADRIHRASKAAEKVSIYTHRDPTNLHREAQKRGVHEAAAIAVHAFAPSFVDALAACFERSTRLEVLRSDGHLYVTAGGTAVDVALVSRPLVSP